VRPLGDVAGQLVEHDLPEPHAADVAHDRAEPAPHGGGLADLVQLAQGDEEGIVHGVLGLRAMPEDLEGQAVEGCPVALEPDPRLKASPPERP
jgi:hypothetical protein